MCPKTPYLPDSLQTNSTKCPCLPRLPCPAPEVEEGEVGEEGAEAEVSGWRWRTTARVGSSRREAGVLVKVFASIWLSAL